ncbi:hypothetical protein WME90_11035 [Sorangium sp. So ce375]|uniref:hypothetical protein n=1 Tax=Sorangium sp. So ce375 TaxID=3133306 RepID=UPI003F5B0A4C
MLAPLSAAMLWSAPARPDEPPQLSWDKPVRCIHSPNGGTVRVQCEPGPEGERCLVAPDHLAYDGGALDKVQPCDVVEDASAYRALTARGARLVAAIPEAPPGYARSAEGKAFQVKFDLLNRLYLGASWLPTFHGNNGLPVPASFPMGRGRAEAGIHLSVLSTRSRARHDMHILEGAATFDDLELSGVLFSYDYQHLHRRPAHWLTTFVGKPRLYAISPRMGWGFRVVSVNDRPPARRDTLDVEFGEVHLAWNPWQSNDMYSHIRIEAGADLGEYWEHRSEIDDGLDTGALYIGPTSAIKSRFSLGEGGLHALSTAFTYRRPSIAAGGGTGEVMNRLEAMIAYEGILLAINDQPISLRLAAMGVSRNDINNDVRDVEIKASAGIRVSFWAPPRVFEPMPAFEEP